MRKSLICLALSLVMVLGTMGMASAYTAGTYEATTTGHNAPITLAVTVNDTAIEKIDVKKIIYVKWTENTTPI